MVLEDDPKTGKKQMQAESPDEEALVDGGKVRLFFVTFFFCGRRGCWRGAGIRRFLGNVVFLVLCSF